MFWRKTQAKPFLQRILFCAALPLSDALLVFTYFLIQLLCNPILQSSVESFVCVVQNISRPTSILSGLPLSPFLGLIPLLWQFYCFQNLYKDLIKELLRISTSIFPHFYENLGFSSCFVVFHFLFCFFNFLGFRGGSMFSGCVLISDCIN